MVFPLLATAFALAEFIPGVSKWLHSDKGQKVAEEVVNIAQNVTNVNDPYDMCKALRTNPDKLLEFQKRVLETQLSWDQMVFQDRRDARARDIAIVQAKNRNVRGDVMVFCAAVGLILCLCSLGYYADNLPGEAVGIISTIAGIFGACLKDAYAFEFGSSRGSKEKDSTVAAMLGGIGGG